MAIAFDSTGSVGAIATSSPLPYTHTPVGTLRGITVFVVTAASGDTVTGVSYGGVGMTRVTRIQDAGGETGSVYGYFLGAGLPTGAQTVSVSFTGSTGHCAASVGVTAAAGFDTAVHNTGSLANVSIVNPVVTIPITEASYIGGALFSGQGAVAQISPGGGYLGIVEYDFGASTAGFERASALVGTDASFGFAQTADDAVILGIAVMELAGGGGVGGGWIGRLGGWW